MGVPYAEVIGDPIQHSKSPAIHKFWLERLGREGDFRAVRVEPGELAAYLNSRLADPDWTGCNVTMPLKEAALPLVEGEPAARAIGAVNLVERRGSRLIGRNSDRHAFEQVLDSLGMRPRRATVVGSGGTARAVLDVLRQRVVESIVLSRDPARAGESLRSQGFEARVERLGSQPRGDLLVNASPLGMIGHPPFEPDLSELEAGAAVVEFVYHPLETVLTAMARERGLRVVDGLTLLIEQAAASFSCFFGEAAPRGSFAELRERLAS